MVRCIEDPRERRRSWNIGKDAHPNPMVSKHAANVIWISVRGLGHVAGVYVPPLGSSSSDPPFTEIIGKLAIDTKEFGTSSRVWILGDMNARVGELSNKVGEEQLRRNSKDKVVNQRGADMMSSLNGVGLWLINGVAHQAANTFENHNGASCIDFMWTSDKEQALKGYDEWQDAVCTVSDHIMVSLKTTVIATTQNKRARRRQAWRRDASDEWSEATNFSWTHVTRECEFESIHTHWSRWKECFEEEATRWVGRTKSRVTKHWKHEWDQELQDLTVAKNKKRRAGICHKLEKRCIRRRKRQILRRRRVMRRQLRENNPKKRIQSMLGSSRKEVPSELCYKGKQLKKEQVSGAWVEMFLKQDSIPVEEDQEQWVQGALQWCRGQTNKYYVSSLDKDITYKEVTEAIRKAPNAKAVGVDGIPMDLVKKGGAMIAIALAEVFKKAFKQEEVPDDWRRGVVVPTVLNSVMPR